MDAINTLNKISLNVVTLIIK